MKTYQNGPYSVTTADDGAIKVKPGDWLSKYSAAIHNDFVHVYEYNRKAPNGTMQAIVNVNQIRAGETIYHLQTGIGTPPRTLSDIEKRNLIRGALLADFKLKGENLKILDSAINYIGYADNALALAEVAGLLAEGVLIAEIVGTASVVLFPVGAMIGIINAYESGQRAYGMRAVAYTITAWAFKDPIPTKSPKILENAQSGFPRLTADELARYDKAWKEASHAPLNMLNQEVIKRRVSKQSLQLLFVAAGAGKRDELCLSLMKGFEKEFDSIQLRVWQSNYSTLYPK